MTRQTPQRDIFYSATERHDHTVTADIQELGIKNSFELVQYPDFAQRTQFVRLVQSESLLHAGRVHLVGIVRLVTVLAKGQGLGLGLGLGLVGRPQTDVRPEGLYRVVPERP